MRPLVFALTMSLACKGSDDPEKNPPGPQDTDADADTDADSDTDTDGGSNIATDLIATSDPSGIGDEDDARGCGCQVRSAPTLSLIHI